MAAPNLRAPGSVIGKTEGYAVGTTLAATLSNGAASGKALKLTTIRACNVDTESRTLTVSRYVGSTHRYLVKGVSVSAGQALIVTTREDYLYLEEGHAVYAQTSAANAFDLTIAYEEIS